MKKVTLCVLVVLLFQFPVFCYGNALSEAGDKVIQILGDNKIKHLYEITRDENYRTRIYFGQVSGIERVIILLGENHYKPDESNLKGEQLLELFSLRGFEKVLPRCLLAKLGANLTRNYFFQRKQVKETDVERPLVLQLVPDLDFDSPEIATDKEVENVGLEMGEPMDLQHFLSGVLLTLSQSHFSIPVGVGSLPLQYLTLGRKMLISSTVLYIALFYAYIQPGGIDLVLANEDQCSWSSILYPVGHFLIPQRNQRMANNLIKSLATRAGASHRAKT